MMQNNSFNDIQHQAGAQMQSQATDNGVREASQHISQAAKTMTQSNMTQVHQTNMLIQAMQQQQSQLSALTASVSSSMAGQNMVPPPMPPPPPPMPSASSSFDNLSNSMRNLSSSAMGIAKTGFGYASAGYGAVAPMVAAHASRFQQNVQMMSNTYNPFSGAAQMGAHSGFGYGGAPGVMHSNRSGIFGNAYQGMGVLYNSHMGQSTNFAHMQDSQFRAMGHGVTDQIHGAAHGALGLASTEKAGSLLGGMGGNYAATAIGGALAGPIGALVAQFTLAPMLASAGSRMGGAMGRPLDSLNPFMLAHDVSRMGTTLGEGANVNAGAFLRGGGSASRPGQFSMTQQGMLGRGLARDSLSDLTFGSDDYAQMQSLFNEGGLNRGVQSASEYRTNFKKRMQDAREIMKTFNLSLEEATQFMSMEFNQMGYGANRSDVRSRMVAAAHMSGMSPMQIAQISAHGVQGAAGLGLMAEFGADATISSAGLAGTAVTMGARGLTGLDSNLLTTVGGEKGLQGMIQQQVMKFAAGAGGTLMALGGGGFGTDVLGGISRAGQGLTGDRVIGFMANRHKELSNQSPEMMQYQHMSYIRGIAQQMSGMGGSEEDRMRLIAQSEGLSPAEADALIEAGKSMKTAGAANSRLQANHLVDQHRDVRTEQFGVKGRMERWLRDSRLTKGLVSGVDTVGRLSDNLGSIVSNEATDFYNRFIGIEEIAGYSFDTAMDAMNVDGSELVGSVGSDEEIRAMQERGRRRRAAVASTRGGSGASIGVGLLGDGYNPLSGLSKEANVAGSFTAASIGAMASSVLMSAVPGAGVIGGSLLGGATMADSPQRKLLRAVTGNADSKAIRSLTADMMGISSSDVTGEDIQFVMEMEGSNERTIRKTLEDLGMEYRDSAIKSTEEIAKAGRSLFINETSGQIVKDHVMMTAMGSGEFTKVMDLLSQASKERKEGPESDQSSKYRLLKSQIKKEIGAIEDPAVQEVVDRVMQSQGIDVSVSGDLDFTNASRSLFGEGWKEKHSSIRGDITAKSRVDFMEKGLGGIVGGVDNARSILDDQGRIKDRDGLHTLLAQYADLNTDELNRMGRDGTQSQRVIASAALKAQRGGRLDDHQLENFASAVMQGGATIGNMIRSADGKDLDEKMMTTETIKALENTNHALASTHQMLELLAKDAGLITRSTAIGQDN